LLISRCVPHLQPVLPVQVCQLPLQPSNLLSSKPRHVTNLQQQQQQQSTTSL
jgi:hypothetical protein